MAHIAVTLGVMTDAFTMGSNVSAGDIISIGDIDYTFATDPSGTAYEVDVGDDADDSVANLIAAINASGTDDDEYGEGTEANPYVTAKIGSDDHIITLTARLAGDQVNGLYTASDTTAVTAEAAAFGLGANSGHADGSGSLPDFVDDLIDRNQINAEVLTALRDLTAADD